MRNKWLRVCIGGGSRLGLLPESLEQRGFSCKWCGHRDKDQCWVLSPRYPQNAFLLGAQRRVRITVSAQNRNELVQSERVMERGASRKPLRRPHCFPSKERQLRPLSGLSGNPAFTCHQLPQDKTMQPHGAKWLHSPSHCRPPAWVWAKGRLSAKLTSDFGIVPVTINSNHRIKVILQHKMNLSLSLDCTWAEMAQRLC